MKVIARSVKFVILPLILGAVTLLFYYPDYDFDIGMNDGYTTDGNITVGYSGIDDIIGVYILNRRAIEEIQDYGEFVPTAEDRWEFNPGPSGRFNLSENLDIGENILFIAVHNLVYTGFCIGVCGKFSYRFQLRAGDRLIKQAVNRVSYNRNRLVYLFSVNVRKTISNDRYVFRFDELTLQERENIKPVARLIEAQYKGQRADINWGRLFEGMQ